MQLQEAESLARALMRRYGLAEWEFGFDGARRRLGACWPQRKRISLSRHFVRLNEEPLVRDVILHEIAHALTPGAGHGARFKRKARELGCNPAACVPREQVKLAPAPYTLECPHCGRNWPRYRRPARKLVCLACLRSSPVDPDPLRLIPAAPTR